MPLPSFEFKTADGDVLFPSGRPTLLCFVLDDCPSCQHSRTLALQAERAFEGSLEVLVLRAEPTVLEGLQLDTLPAVMLADGKGEALLHFAGFSRADWQALFERLISVCLSPAPIVEWKAYPTSAPGCPAWR